MTEVTPCCSNGAKRPLPAGAGGGVRGAVTALALGALLAASPGRAGEAETPPAPEVERDVYSIAPGDTIAVTVFERGDLSAQALVPREGTVVLPGAGVVQVAGRGVEELSRDVARLLGARERLRDARVVVSIVSYGARKAFVYGARGGARAVDLPAATDTTLLQAIATSGGFAADADRSRVRITRRAPGRRRASSRSTRAPSPRANRRSSTPSSSRATSSTSRAGSPYTCSGR